MSPDESRNESTTTTPECPEQPRAPNPSADPGIVPDIEALTLQEQTDLPSVGDFDVLQLDAQVAMKVLSVGMQALADMTGDVPATPPAMTSLHDMRNEGLLRPRTGSLRPVTPPSSVPSHDIKSASFITIPIGKPEAHLTEPMIIGPGTIVTMRAQYDAIARKFYSRKPAPVSIDEYLKRLHRYCPMSTGVYLAAGVYILRLTAEERAIPLTQRTAHRLLLASLRVAMKALEDLSYPHERFAGVGGVSQAELAKLEISLCYLLDWDLKVDVPLLYEKTRNLQQIAHRSLTSSIPFSLPKVPNFRDAAHRRRTVT